MPVERPLRESGFGSLSGLDVRVMSYRGTLLCCSLSPIPGFQTAGLCHIVKHFAVATPPLGAKHSEDIA
jgi:hypothetical protein